MYKYIYIYRGLVSMKTFFIGHAVRSRSSDSNTFRLDNTHIYYN